MVINTKYDIGEKVYLKTDSEQKERVVTQILMTPGTLIYTLSCGTEETTHYDMEISIEKDIVKKINE